MCHSYDVREVMEVHTSCSGSFTEIAYPMQIGH